MTRRRRRREDESGRRREWMIVTAALGLLGVLLLSLYLRTITREPLTGPLTNLVTATPAPTTSNFGRAELTVIINGEQQDIPKLEEGKYIQIPKEEYLLGEALVRYEVLFSQECIMGHCENDGGKLTATINGQEVENYPNETLEDGDEVVIRFEDDGSS